MVVANLREVIHQYFRAIDVGDLETAMAVFSSYRRTHFFRAAV